MRKRATSLLVFCAWLLALRVAGQGLAPTATPWTLPAGGTIYGGIDHGFETLWNTGTNSSAGDQSWAVMDLNGDARPDLVVTGQNGTDGSYLPFGTAPNRYWKVYPGTSTGFATAATTWALPSGGTLLNGTDYGFPGLSGNGGSSNDVGNQVWAVTDLDGDARPDLVVTAQKVTSGAYLPFGTAPNRYWKVYRNTGTGFAPTATTWALPAGGYLYGGTDYGFPGLSGSGGSLNDVGSQSWMTTDLNGDARPDLVVLSQKGTGSTYLPFGTAPNRYWKVYLGTSTGFAPTATAWTLPGGGCLYDGIDYGFDALSNPGYSSNAVGDQSWVVTDLNGDARPDLVVTGQKGPGGRYLLFGTAPNRYWKVYLGTDAGFAPTATSWMLPTGGNLDNGTDYGFAGFSGFSGSLGDVGSQTWVVTDLDGDARPDLVVTAQKVTGGSYLPFGTAPNRYWKVYLGASAGFAPTATAWALPAGGHLYGGTDYGFSWVLNSASISSDVGDQVWSMLDFNGDAKPDLVVTTQKATGGSYALFGTAPNRYWKVYLSTSPTVTATTPASVADGVRLYPNPATSQLTLSGPASLAGQSYFLLDALGRVVRAGQFGAAEPTLDVQALPAGMYGVRLGAAPRLLRFSKY